MQCLHPAFVTTVSAPLLDAVVLAFATFGSAAVRGAPLQLLQERVELIREWPRQLILRPKGLTELYLNGALYSFLIKGHRFPFASKPTGNNSVPMLSFLYRTRVI